MAKIDYKTNAGQSPETPQATNPTAETSASINPKDECPWKQIVYDAGDHYADSVDFIPDDIL